MLNRLLLTINKYNMIKRNDIVVVGVSGGVDSVALLHALYCLKDELGIILHVAHLNHQFRGEDAKEDARFVQKFSAQLGLGCTVEEFDVPAYIRKTKLSPEEAAREIRYNFFADVAQQLQANKVALAHNANDQAETVLFNFLRGSGSEGLGGMPPIRDELYIRPIIEIWRPEIENYCAQNKLQTRLDKTNSEKIYTRNKIRLDLLPYLQKEFNPNIMINLVKTGDILRQENKYLQEITNQVIEQLAEVKEGRITIELKQFAKQPLPVQRRILKSTANLLSQGNNLEFKHIDDLITFADQGHSGAQLDLPGSLRALKNYEQLILTEHEIVAADEFRYELKVPGETKIKEVDRLIKAEIINHNNIKISKEQNPNIAYFDYDKLPAAIVVRNRCDGDVFSPLGLGGNKKLKDFLIDIKIPRVSRNAIPMLVSGNEIIWVAGIRISDKWKVTEKTKKILKLVII